MSVAIRLINLTITYSRQVVIQNLTQNINCGELLAIVGPNGAGKSTLLNALAKTIPVTQGRIEGPNRENIAYLPQHAHIQQAFPLTVLELAATGLWSSLGAFRPIMRNHLERCYTAISALGLEGYEHRMINTLSGGQLQRALFARVLVENKPVILLDEPFNAIDEKTISDLTLVMQSWHEEKRTVIMVSHDLQHIRKFFPTTLLLARKGLSYGKTEDVLTEENITLAYQLHKPLSKTIPWSATPKNDVHSAIH